MHKQTQWGRLIFGVPGDASDRPGGESDADELERDFTWFSLNEFNDALRL